MTEEEVENRKSNILIDKTLCPSLCSKCSRLYIDIPSRIVDGLTKDTVRWYCLCGKYSIDIGLFLNNEYQKEVTQRYATEMYKLKNFPDKLNLPSNCNYLLEYVIKAQENEETI